MNWTVIIDYIPAYREAMLLTLRIRAMISILPNGSERTSV